MKRVKNSMESSLQDNLNENSSHGHGRTVTMETIHNFV